jgi:6-phosphogluconate dehydrogenase
VQRREAVLRAGAGCLGCSVDGGELVAPRGPAGCLGGQLDGQDLALERLADRGVARQRG